MNKQSAIDIIRGYKGLQNNWDSYGSPPMPYWSIRNAINVVRLLVMPPVWIGACPDGSVQMEWGNEYIFLEINVYSDRIEFLYGVYDAWKEGIFLSVDTINRLLKDMKICVDIISI